MGAGAKTGNKGPSGKGCDLADLFGLLGESYVLDILHFLMADARPRRFVEIQRALQISANTLTHRLNRLVAAGLLQRTAYQEIPPRVEYNLTRKASDFEEAFKVFQGWARTHTLAPEPAAAVSGPAGR